MRLMNEQFGIAHLDHSPDIVLFLHIFCQTGFGQGSLMFLLSVFKITVEF